MKKEQGARAGELRVNDMTKVEQGEKYNNVVNQQFRTIIFRERGDCIPGLRVDIFRVSVTVTVTVSFAPFFEGDCKRMEGYSRHAIFMPESLNKINPLVMSVFGGHAGCEELIGIRESLIQDGNQTIAQGGTCLDRSLIQSGLKLQLLPCFIFQVISLQFAPVGQRIVGQFEGIGFVRFYLPQRIVAELVR